MTTSSPLADAPAAPHSVWEDVFGMATGVILVSFGLYLLEAAALVTGGTAGLSLLLSLGTSWGFGLLFVLVNLPFFLLAVRRKGWVFSLKSAVSIGAVSVVIGSLFVVPTSNVLISALGAAVLNVVLVLNHRPGRYTGY